MKRCGRRFFTGSVPTAACAARGTLLRQMVLSDAEIEHSAKRAEKDLSGAHAQREPVGTRRVEGDARLEFSARDLALGAAPLVPHDP